MWAVMSRTLVIAMCHGWVRGVDDDDDVEEDEDGCRVCNLSLIHI